MCEGIGCGKVYYGYWFWNWICLVYLWRMGFFIALRVIVAVWRWSLRVIYVLVTSFTRETKWISTLNSVSIRCDWMDGNREVALGSRESITEVIIRNRGDWTFRLSPYCLVKSLCAFSASSQMTWQDLLGSISPLWFFYCMSLLISLLNWSSWLSAKQRTHSSHFLDDLSIALTLWVPSYWTYGWPLCPEYSQVFLYTI